MSYLYPNEGREPALQPPEREHGKCPHGVGLEMECLGCLLEAEEYREDEDE